MTYANITIEDLASDQADKMVKIVKISGQLDESNVDEQSKTIYQLIEANPKNLYLIFDFSELEYLNSKAIGYLTDWYGKISAESGQIAISMAQENIVDILQVVGLTQLITCHVTLDEAKTAMLAS
ncbi:STAS domain-containing protein [Candidatus Peregrinibacteria bacterium]|jgi:stage II sporulation protein AA (anti-sigma F factor antagonist)|nr:STAS domain-containing protein [Candidatus Peregrinibacteria bacterium]